MYEIAIFMWHKTRLLVEGYKNSSIYLKILGFKVSGHAYIWGWEYLKVRLRLQVLGYQYMVSGYKYKGCKCEDAI